MSGPGAAGAPMPLDFPGPTRDPRGGARCPVATMTIRLQTDPRTGKKNIVVSYASDADALPMEHEEAHRRLVDRVIEGGALRAAEVGRVVIEREGATERVRVVQVERAEERAARKEPG